MSLWVMEKVVKGRRVRVAQMNTEVDGYVVAGKSENCTVVCQNTSCSRNHARIGWSGRGLKWTVEDLNSANGTRVGDTKLKPNTLTSVRGRISPGAHQVLTFLADSVPMWFGPASDPHFVRCISSPNELKDEDAESGGLYCDGHNQKAQLKEIPLCDDDGDPDIKRFWSCSQRNRCSFFQYAESRAREQTSPHADDDLTFALEALSVSTAEEKEKGNKKRGKRGNEKGGKKGNEKGRDKDYKKEKRRDKDYKTETEKEIETEDKKQRDKTNPSQRLPPTASLHTDKGGKKPKQHLDPSSTLTSDQIIPPKDEAEKFVDESRKLSLAPSKVVTQSPQTQSIASPKPKYQDAAATRELQKCVSEWKTLQNISANLPDGGQKLREKIRDGEARLAIQLSLPLPPPKPVSPVSAPKHEWRVGRGSPSDNQKSRSLPKFYRAQNLRDVSPSRIQSLLVDKAGDFDGKELDLDEKTLRVKLLEHQRQGLWWMVQRERPHPDRGEARDAIGTETEEALSKHDEHRGKGKKKAVATSLDNACAETEKSVCGGILADDMGLGKTVSILALCLHSIRQGLTSGPGKENARPLVTEEGVNFRQHTGTLVICPSAVMRQWEDEIVKKSAKKLKVVVFHGTNRGKKIDSDATFVLTTYGTVEAEMRKVLAEEEDARATSNCLEKSGRELLSVRAKLQSVLHSYTWHRIVLDEAHVIRNFKSKTCRAVCELEATNRWFVTATPVQNSAEDVFSIFKFLRAKPLHDYDCWRRIIGRTDSLRIDRLQSVLRPLMLRRRKSQKKADGSFLIELPRKEVVLHRLDWGSEEEEQAYRSLRDRAMNDLSKLKSRNGHDTPCQVLLRLLRLRQCCNSLELVDKPIVRDEGDVPEIDEIDEIASSMASISLDKGTEHVRLNGSSESQSYLRSRSSTKIRFILSTLKKIPRDDKIVIFSQWTSMLNLVSHHVAEAGYDFCRIDGSTNADKRGKQLRNFEEVKEKKLMLISLKAGGVGLNLVQANHVFMIDPWFNPAIEDQAYDRVYRIGQTKDVTVHRIIMKGTVEENLLRMQEKKKLLQQDAIEHSAEKKHTKKWSIQDLMSLFKR